jgi:hypothetical protein
LIRGESPAGIGKTMNLFREFFFGNWRNKGVALFFAVTIWVVAYQSEKQEFSTTLRVELLPSDPKYIITKTAVLQDLATGRQLAFDGSIRADFSGPRKQIDKLRDQAFPPMQVVVPTDKPVYSFREEDLGFPRDGVDISRFTPETIIVTQEEEETVFVKDLPEKIHVTDYPEGFEVASKDVIPSSQRVTIAGPKSIAGRLTASVNVSMSFSRERFEGRADVVLSVPDDIPQDLVSRTVKVRPAQVMVSVALRASMEVLPVDAVRLTFRVPPLKVPVKIVLDDIVGDTIPVEFHGRKDEILRLKDKLREQPGLSLGVRVPSTFDREQGGQFTFTEDSLELYGFPGVQIRQHESRRREKKTAWSYTIVPVKEEAK